VVAQARLTDDLYRRIVYGSGDDAAMSELFGIESPYSERAEQIRRELIELEGRIFSGDATKDEEARYRTLSRLLVSSSSARIEEVTARLGRKDRVITVRRVGLDVQFAKKLDRKTTDLKKKLDPLAEGKARTNKARTDWRNAAALRRNVLKILFEMASGVERCMYCGDGG
jgi:hypothetical protein